MNIQIEVSRKDLTDYAAEDYFYGHGGEPVKTITGFGKADAIGRARAKLNEEFVNPVKNITNAVRSKMAFIEL